MLKHRVTGQRSNDTAILCHYRYSQNRQHDYDGLAIPLFISTMYLLGHFLHHCTCLGIVEASAAPVRKQGLVRKRDTGAVL